MKRFKKHKVKVEKPEASNSHSRQADDYDLAYYIHDRVELMHQVFSVLKHKDLKSMAPECVRHISIDDLQELCTEELLGISSKRLCAILDGANPPSDTESSSESPERMETISLDSISSDEEILSETSSKKSKKHKRHRRDSKTKSKKKKNKDNAETENPAEVEKSKASRAGLTVLELLELQARARAIRAQLQQEHAAKQAAEPAPSSHHSSDNEVEIKEEAPEVVEISSEDEKPNVEELKEKSSAKAKEPEKPPDDNAETHTVTKRINDLIITVPHVKQTRKIKLNRSKITVSVANKETRDDDVTEVPTTTKEVEKPKEVPQNTTSSAKQAKSIEKQTKSKEKQKRSKEEEAKAKEKKKKPKKNNKNKNQDSDHDEITLQLSDTEKMDLLEDLDRKNFEKLSSSDSEDSESSSSDSESGESEATAKSSLKQKESPNKDKNTAASDQNKEISDNDKDSSVDALEKSEELDKTGSTDVEMTVEKPNEVEIKSIDSQFQESVVIVEDTVESQQTLDNTESINAESSNKIDEENPELNDNSIEVSSINDIPVIEDEQKDDSVNVPSSPVKETEIVEESPTTDTKDLTDSPKNDSNNKSDSPSHVANSNARSPTKNSPTRRDSSDKNAEDRQTSRVKISVEISSTSSDQGKRTVQIENIDGNSQATSEKDMSEGEISDRESSDIEAVDLKPEVVCISDDDTDKKAHKKKKKKEKKSKSKKSKKSKQDFREVGDQNFYKETELNGEVDQNVEKNIDEVVAVEEESKSFEEDDYDDVYEILELSDDSSCYEVEGTVLSKEPTTEEIEALSAKIDEIEREEVVTEEEIREHERRNNGETENIEELENISWKDRYLDSKKVKKVLSTSSIFNALRKKNRELKKKLEESKKKEDAVPVLPDENTEIIDKNVPLEEGSIEHYNTLQGSTKYVDPVPEIIEKGDAAVETDASNGENENGEVDKNGEDGQTGETKNGEVEQTPQVGKALKKDAKQLLKMYKRLMKYHDMNKKKDPNKQKDPNKKKKKKSKKKNKDGANPINAV
ncbi:hypothetical protein ABMA28_012446 [Loxostege sticticalis]|uniref:Uncharacterized protein n=1 Tax=Loxostege sticticalis TaxID=481309 RepID=A0ABD0S3W1_LOXSC